MHIVSRQAKMTLDQQENMLELIGEMIFSKAPLHSKLMTPAETYYTDGEEISYGENGEEARKRVEGARTNKIYRHGDADRIERALESNQVVILEAEMGAGKSSVIRSLLNHFEREEVLFFNGHKFGNDTDVLDQLKIELAKATEKTKILIIDSADYLFQKKKYIRSRGKDYFTRCKTAMEEIDSFKKSHPNIKIVLTSHDENWRKIKADNELYNMFSEKFHQATAIHPSSEVTETTTVRYLEHEEGFTRDEAWYIAKIWANPIAINILNEMGYLKRNRGEISGTTLLRTPRIISQIFKKFPSLKEEFKKTSRGETNGNEPNMKNWIKKFINCALETDYQSIFLPIITAVRGSERARIWGIIEPIEPQNSASQSD